MHSSKKWHQTNNNNIPVKLFWSPKDIRYSWKSKASKENVKGPKNHQLDECKFCGRKHEQRRRKCPVYGQLCSSCGKPYDFAVKCQSTTSDSKRPSQKPKKKKYCQHPQEMLLIPWKWLITRAKHLPTWNWWRCKSTQESCVISLVYYLENFYRWIPLWAELMWN